MIGLRLEVMFGRAWDLMCTCAPSVGRNGRMECVSVKGAAGLLGRGARGNFGWLVASLEKGLEGLEDGFAAPEDGAIANVMSSASTLGTKEAGPLRAKPGACETSWTGTYGRRFHVCGQETIRNAAWRSWCAHGHLARQTACLTLAGAPTEAVDGVVYATKLRAARGEVRIERKEEEEEGRAGARVNRWFYARRSFGR